MSLLGQTARYLLITAFSIAVVGAVGFYILIHRQIRHEVDELLAAQVKQAALKIRQQPVSHFPDWDNNPRIEPATAPIQPRYADLSVLDSAQNNAPVPIRQLQETVRVNGRLYLITIQLPYYEFNELAREMSVGVIIGFLILMGLSVGIGIGLSRRLWHPFYTTIDQLREIRLDTGAGLTFPESRIREFSLLTFSLSELTRKLQQQFLLQKQFTENASHELQTPLAIASAELDFLMQSDHLTETDHTHLQRATDSLRRLSQLNRSLLLLAQVENNQFASDESLNMSELLKQYCDEYQPFFQHKQMHIDRAIAPSVYVKMNRQLAGVLLTNLLKNAVRHGSARHGSARRLHAGHTSMSSELAGSQVSITLTPDVLCISNTGEPMPFPEGQLFNRFVKNPSRPDSTGLGLALVKQICDRYGLPVTYRYIGSEATHEFRVGLGR